MVAAGSEDLTLLQQAEAELHVATTNYGNNINMLSVERVFGPCMDTSSCKYPQTAQT